MKGLSDEEKKRVRKQLERLLEDLRSSTIFVEGKKDLSALASLGCTQLFTISGNLRYSCEIAKKKNAKRVIVLTDLDRRGDELADEAQKELERYGIKADIKMRRSIGRVLSLREFESMHKKYEELWSEITK